MMVSRFADPLWQTEYECLIMCKWRERNEDGIAALDYTQTCCFLVVASACSSSFLSLFIRSSIVMTYHAIKGKKERNNKWHRLISKLNNWKQCVLCMCLYICVCLSIESRQASRATDHDLEKERKKTRMFNHHFFSSCNHPFDSCYL